MATRTSPEPVVSDSELTAELVPSLRRTTVHEYHRMIDAGILGEDDHVELLDGLIVTMSPQNPPHAIVIERLNDPVFIGLPPEFRIRPQLPMTLASSEPEPDIVIVPRSSSYAASHPRHAPLVIEVSGESIGRDRRVKRSIYARAGIPEYVIADVDTKQLEVYRDPDVDAGTYRTPQTLTTTDCFVSSAVPGLAFAVADLFRDLG